MIVGTYLAPAFSREAVRKIIRAFREMTREVEFDTVVVTGTSGLLMGPTLARATRKHLAVVRKAGDGSHSWAKVEGYKAGRKAVFVDDLVFSGETAERVRKTALSEMGNLTWAGVFLWNTESERWRNVDWIKRVPVHEFRCWVDANGKVSSVYHKKHGPVEPAQEVIPYSASSSSTDEKKLSSGGLLNPWGPKTFDAAAWDRLMGVGCWSSSSGKA